MPLNQVGFVSHGSSVDEQIEHQIREVFSMLDRIHNSLACASISLMAVKSVKLEARGRLRVRLGADPGAGVGKTAPTVLAS